MDFKNSFVAEWYDRTDFFDAKFFLLGSFFAHFFQKWWIKKWPQQKKLVKWKISFFMPINHVQKFMISVHSRIVICPFCIGGSIHLQSPCKPAIYFRCLERFISNSLNPIFFLVFAYNTLLTKVAQFWNPIFHLKDPVFIYKSTPRKLIYYRRLTLVPKNF